MTVPEKGLAVVLKVLLQTIIQLITYAVPLSNEMFKVSNEDTTQVTVKYKIKEFVATFAFTIFLC